MTTAVETTIAAIWRDLLRLETVGPDQNFFDLGGNSLLMIRFHHRLETVLGISIPVVRLFERPTIRSLADILRGEEPIARSQQQLLGAVRSNPLRSSDGATRTDPIAERARKQLSARADLRERSANTEGR
jgi:hypothetical protein